MGGNSENSKLKVGFITPEYPHPKVNRAAGIASTTKNLALMLVKKNIPVTVFIYHQDKNAVFESEGVEIHLIKSKKYLAFGWYLHRKHINIYINHVVKENGINILEAPDWTGITAFMNFNVPLVIRLHGTDGYFCKLEGRKQKFKNKWFEANALKLATTYIAPTSFAGKETAKIFNLDKSKIKTIHFGLPIEKFKNEVPEKYNDNTILYIGTIIRKKGVFELAKIFNKVVQRIPDAELVLIGGDSPDIETDSPSTFELIKKEFSNKALNNVKYLGKVAYDDVINHIKNAHICVFPSFAETFGMVTIEAMALSKPIVNTNIGWANEIIDNEINGYLVHPKDIKLYSDKILKLLDDRYLCLKMGNNARKKVISEFNANKQVDLNIEYYSTIVK